MDQYRRLTREHAELTPVVELFNEYRAAEADLATAAEMLADPEMKAFAEAEVQAAKDRMEALDAELQKLLLPKDPDDERNMFLEMRAGTGGDEAALFAGDLFRMYTRFAERNRWQVEVVSESAAEVGGYKEVIARIIGYGAYSRLKFESGAHRVQRVPATEAQGRIHTSACTVAVMPEADEVDDVVLNPADLAHRHLPRVGRRRPARQQDRFRRAHHAPADRHRRRVPGRPLAAQEQGAGDVGAGGAHQGRAAARAARQGSRDSASRWSARATARSASAPTTFRRAASPTTASTSRSTRSTTSWTATWTS